VVRFHPSTNRSVEDLYGTDDEWGSRALPPGRRAGAVPGGPLLTFEQAKEVNLSYDRIGSKEARQLSINALSKAGRAVGALQPVAQVGPGGSDQR
jgi:hypothetical protein